MTASLYEYGEGQGIVSLVSIMAEVQKEESNTSSRSGTACS